MLLGAVFVVLGVAGSGNLARAAKPQPPPPPRFVDNLDGTASRRVMEKLGMRREADREVFGFRAVCYAVSRDAFLRQRPTAPAPA